MAGRDRARLRTASRMAARLLGVALLGAIAAVFVAVFTPAHVDIAGSDARVWLQLGHSYDQLGVDGVLTGKRATTRSVLGEPLGVRAELDIDASVLTDSSGQFNVNILPAYIQAYSDPEQLTDEIRGAVVLHFVAFAAIGAGAALSAFGAWRGYRAWRARYDRTHWPDGPTRTAVRAYRAPERGFARRLAVGVILLAVLGAIPSGVHQIPASTAVIGDAIFDETPLAGIEVQGLLRPAFVAVQSYIETYFNETNSYYDELRTGLEDYLTANPVELPGASTGTGTNPVVQLGFVTDRHCNIGMDRVVVALLHHFDVHTLVSAGDDAFSGTFAFESACTRNLADKSAQFDITDVFVGGNHDSPQTIADEAKQGIKTLTGKVVTSDGVRFIGRPDPRTSRYGQGIVPAARAAQLSLLEQQGTAAGKTGCAASAPVIAVLHDPVAGKAAMRHGCGHVTLALDGHTHHQSGPNVIPLPGGGTGYQFTGASSGGAPGEESIEQSFASRLTVGPLNHDATVNIVSVDRSTGALVGVTVFRFTPDQTITVSQQDIS